MADGSLASPVNALPFPLAAAPCSVKDTPPAQTCPLPSRKSSDPIERAQRVFFNGRSGIGRLLRERVRGDRLSEPGRIVNAGAASPSHSIALRTRPVRGFG